MKLNINVMEKNNIVKMESGNLKAESWRQKMEIGKWRIRISSRVQASSFNFQFTVYCLLFSTLTLTLQTNAQVISLDSVLHLIDKQNPMLQEYDSKVKALNTYTEGAKSWMAPMVGAGTFMTPYPGQLLMDERDKGSVMFSIEQNIPNPAKLNANKKYP